jgi:hypothetical protein
VNRGADEVDLVAAEQQVARLGVDHGVVDLGALDPRGQAPGQVDVARPVGEQHEARVVAACERGAAVGALLGLLARRQAAAERLRQRLTGGQPGIARPRGQVG